MIKYRPHRGLLADAMLEAKEFNTIEEMYNYILSDWNSKGLGVIFRKEDLSIEEDFGEDKRIGWKETRCVCTKRMMDKIYKTPQCIGMCSIE